MIASGPGTPAPASRVDCSRAIGTASTPLPSPRMVGAWQRGAGMGWRTSGRFTVPDSKRALLSVQIRVRWKSSAPFPPPVQVEVHLMILVPQSLRPLAVSAFLLAATPLLAGADSPPKTAAFQTLAVSPEAIALRGADDA